MKILLASILLSTTLSSFAMAAEKPSFGTSIDEETKAVTLEVYNNDRDTVHCKYSVSWLANVLTYKKQFGEMVIASNSTTSVTFMNDRADHISRLHANVSCE
jgi:hypothetical protein